jgi:hypothetical protein
MDRLARRGDGFADAPVDAEMKREFDATSVG